MRAALTLTALLLTSSIVTAVDSPALRKTTPTLRFDEIALSDALDYFRDAAGINLAVDWKALEAAGVAKDATVSLRLSSVSIRFALRKTLEAAAPGLLTFYVEENVIQVTTKVAADARPVVRVYAVSDLIKDAPDFTDFPEIALGGRGSGSRTSGSGGGGGGGQQSLFGGAGGRANQNAIRKLRGDAEKGDALITLIQTTVRPEVWNTNGGTSAIRYANGQLIVTAPIDVQRLIGG